MGETPLSTGLALRRVGVLQDVNPASGARARLGKADGHRDSVPANQGPYTRTSLMLYG